MDPLMPRPPVNRLPFDDPDAEWLDEPSDQESCHAEEPELDGSNTEDQQEGANRTLTKRWCNEFDNAEGRDLEWRIDQHNEWMSNGADGHDEFFGHFIAAKKFVGNKVGYIFKVDHLGLGYYRDRPGRVALCLEAATLQGKCSPHNPSA